MKDRIKIGNIELFFLSRIWQMGGDNGAKSRRSFRFRLLLKPECINNKMKTISDQDLDLD